jgi:hypothetical protein
MNVSNQGIGNRLATRACPLRGSLGALRPSSGSLGADHRRLASLVVQHQLRHPDQVASCGHQIPPRPVQSSPLYRRTPETTPGDSLHPPEDLFHPLARSVTRMAGGSAVYCAGPSVARSSRLFLQPSVEIHRCGRDCEVLDPTTVRVDSRPLAQTDEWHFVVQDFLDSVNDARPLL